MYRVGRPIRTALLRISNFKRLVIVFPTSQSALSHAINIFLGLFCSAPARNACDRSSGGGDSEDTEAMAGECSPMDAAQRRLSAISAHLQPPAACGGVDLAANPTAGEYADGTHLFPCLRLVDTSKLSGARCCDFDFAFHSMGPGACVTPLLYGGEQLIPIPKRCGGGHNCVRDLRGAERLFSYRIWKHRPRAYVPLRC